MQIAHDGVQQPIQTITLHDSMNQSYDLMWSDLSSIPHLQLSPLLLFDTNNGGD